MEFYEVGGEIFLPIGIKSRSERRVVVDDYCNQCGADDVPLIVLWDDTTTCEKCAVHLHVCEICGSTRDCTTPAEEQIHYEEECFK